MSASESQLNQAVQLRPHPIDVPSAAVSGFQYRPTILARLQVFVLNRVARVALKIVLRRTSQAIRVNRRVLREILVKNQHTSFGSEHRFQAVITAKSLEAAYKDAVSVSRYDEYASYIDQIAAGVDRVLTADTVDLLAGSSGTTCRPKQLPMTRLASRTFAFFRLAQRGAVIDCFERAGSAARGVNLMSTYVSQGSSGAIPVASLPNAALKALERQIPILWTSPPEVFNLQDQPTAQYLHALFGLRDPEVTSVIAMFAPHMALWFSQIEADWEDLVRDIRSGTLRDDLRLDTCQRQALEVILQPDPQRAADLQREFSRGVCGILPRIWPKIGYLAAATTGSFALYQDRLRKFAGNNLPIYSPGHSSSEAVIGINTCLFEADEYTLAVGSVYFEFLPVEEIESEFPKPIGLESIVAGGEYEVILTNRSGLYRYRLGDIIRITRFLGEAPVYRFVRRAGVLLNLVGEKTNEFQLASAIEAFCLEDADSFGELVEFCVSFNKTGENYRYRIFVETSQIPQCKKAELNAFAKKLDKQLSRTNPYYQFNGRDVERLGPIQLCLVRAGAFEQLRKYNSNNFGMGNAGQAKPQRLVIEPKQLEFLESATIADAEGL